MNYRNVSAQQQLELYVSPTCPYCREARAHYDALGTAYVAYDAQNDRAARARMLALADGDPTVPVIVVDGVYMRSGWGDPPRG